MSDRELALEILRLALGAPFLSALVVGIVLVLFREDLRALMRRVAKLRFPGGELTTQAERAAVEESQAEELPPPSPDPPQLPGGLTLSPEEQQKLLEFVKAERARAALWEYRFLNLYLVSTTQRVLDWFISLGQRTSLQMFDAVWQPMIPDAQERRAIVSALQNHHLVNISGELIEVTLKGREYAAWRGPLPQPAA